MYQRIRELVTVLLYLSSDRKEGPGEFRVQNDPTQVRRSISSSLTSSAVSPYYHNFGLYDIRNAIKFRLWTRENPILAHEIIVHDRQSLHGSNFDSNRLTKIFVHGKDQRSNEERLDPETVYMRDAYLRFADVNFILVDWTSMAKGFRYFTNYGDIVSHRIVEFLKFLNRQGHTPLGSLHMIGLSWGAHVIGKAGHMLGSKIGRLTGLDPAGPLFHSLPERDVLDKSDAQFVDIIHTDAGSSRLHSGISRILGHVDFFPNGGKAQPGCPPRDDPRHHKDLPCSHERSVDLFSESIGSPLSFPSCEKRSWDQYVVDGEECNAENVTFMGEHIPTTARGVFYLRTSGRRPFGLGQHMDVIMPNIPNVHRNRIMFDPSRLRFHSLNTASRSSTTGTGALHPHPRSRSRSSSTLPHVIVKTETNYSPSNGTNLVLFPSHVPYTPQNYPNNQVLRHCLLLARRPALTG